jgi:hypothetical protein
MAVFSEKMFPSWDRMPPERVAMSASAAEQARAQARVLRDVAAGLERHNTGSAWRSPAKNLCDARVEDLQRQALVIARQLELWAQSEGAASLRAEQL